MAPRTKKAAAVIVIYIMLKRIKRRRNRKVWVQKWISRRPTHGTHENLFRELQLEDESALRRFIRMDYSGFKYILNRISPLIAKEDTIMRKAITPAEKLCVTLRYLATGETYSSLSFSFRIGRSTIGLFIPIVCNAIVSTMSVDHLAVPSTENSWLNIANGFLKWNFPNCIGALDGKHVVIQAPAHSGSDFYNYKDTFSIVLLAIVDANYRFIFVDVGQNGRMHDSTIWESSTFQSVIATGSLDIPKSRALPYSTEEAPFVIVADSAFALKEHVMKPFPDRGISLQQRIFNYRLSRARRVVENAFGILTWRWQIYRSPLRLMPEKVETIVMATCILHNFLTPQTPVSHFDNGDVDDASFTPGIWRQQSASRALQPLPPPQQGRISNVAKHVRDKFVTHFNGVGAVPWQSRIL